MLKLFFNDDVNEKMLLYVFSVFRVLLLQFRLIWCFNKFNERTIFSRKSIRGLNYAYKKLTQGERHGSVAESILVTNIPISIYTPMFPI